MRRASRFSAAGRARTADDASASNTAAQSARAGRTQAPKVYSVPGVEVTTRSAISLRKSVIRDGPEQCMGMSTSGSSALNSARVLRR